MRYFNIVLSASLMLLFCILSVSPVLAAADAFVPYKVAVGPDGNVYAATSDSAARHINAFALNGTLVKTLDLQANDLAFDDAGNLYVLCSKTGRNLPDEFNIMRLDSGGNATVLWSDINQSRPIVNDMAVTPDGRIYFSIIYPNQSYNAKAGGAAYDRSEIDVIDTNGTLRVVMTKNFTSFSDCYAMLAIDRNGTIYTTMGVSNRITAISPDGTTETIGKLGSANGTFNSIIDITIGPDGYLYVVESGNRRMQKLTTDGTFVAKWGGCGPDPFIGHISPAIDENGRIYVADQDNRRIVWFTPDYTYGTDENENMKGQGVTWGTIYAGTNYTTQLLERQFEELQNESEPTPMPGFAAFTALIGIGLGVALYCLRK